MTTIETTSGFQPDHLWSYVLELFYLRWVIFVRGFLRAKPLHRAVILLPGLLFLGIAVGVYLLATAFFRLLNSPLILESGVIPVDLTNAIPALIVSVAFLGILVMSFGVLLQALYMANDMDFLVAMPVPIRAVFLTKLLQAILPNFILVTLFGLPVLFGLGTAGGYQILYYPLVLVVLAFLSLSAAGISSLLVMVVVRIFPAKRVAEVLAFLGLVVFMVLSQLSNLTDIKLVALSPEQIFQGTQALSGLNRAWFPLAWGGRALVDLGEGRWLSGFFFLALTLSLSVGIFWFALNAAERLYITGWASLRISTAQKKTSRAAGREGIRLVPANFILRILPSDVRALLVKEFLVLRRDLRNISQVVAPLIMGIVFTVMLLRNGTGTLAGNDETSVPLINLIRSALPYQSAAIALLIGFSLISKLASVSFSMEGKSYWILKTSPVSAGKLLAAKYLIAYLPALILSWLFLTGISFIQKIPSAILLYAFPCIALILAGLCGIDLAIGVRFANLKWTDPRQMTHGNIGGLGFSVGFAYLLVSSLSFIAPPIALPLLGMSHGTGQLVGLLVGGTVALLCIVLPLRRAEEQVYRIGEE